MVWGTIVSGAGGRPPVRYRGAVLLKFENLRRYRFAFCYENIMNVQGYISEKIFDAFHSGTVPIYLGATNVTDYVPSETFIDRRAFRDLDSLVDFLISMREEKYQQYLNAIDRFLQSAQYERFSPSTFAHTVRDALLSMDRDCE